MGQRGRAECWGRVLGQSAGAEPQASQLTSSLNFIIVREMNKKTSQGNRKRKRVPKKLHLCANLFLDIDARLRIYMAVTRSDIDARLRI